MTEVRKIVVQQPQFLPWAGLWYKFMSSDVYVLYCGVKFDQGDHQHRVTLNGSWLTLPVEKGQRNALIKDVQLAEDFHAGLDKIAKTIRQSCMGRKAKHRDKLGDIVATLDGWSSRWMLDLNNELFEAMAKALGLIREIEYDMKVRDEEKIDKLDACLRQYMGPQRFLYLAGGGGLDYMGYDSLMSPVATRFQRMKAGTSPDSVLQLIANHDDPLSVIAECAQWVTKEGETREWFER
jgi:hypothetical protein